MKGILKKFFSKEVLIFLLLLNTGLHYMNFRFEKVDLPNTTRNLVIDTIKRELAVEVYCNKDGCKKEVKNLENVVDEISYASQLGRLDTISLLLAMLGLILGFGAIAGFLHIKENAERIAQIETTRWLEENAEKIASKSADKAVKKAVKKVFENSELVQKAKRESKSKKVAKNESQYYED